MACFVGEYNWVVIIPEIQLRANFYTGCWCGCLDTSTRPGIVAHGVIDEVLSMLKARFSTDRLRHAKL